MAENPPESAQERAAVVDALVEDAAEYGWGVQRDVERIADAVIAAVARARGDLAPGDERHGLNGYTNLGCRCAICRDANQEKVASGRAERKNALAADPSIVEHGRASTYQNWGCRCPICTRVATEQRTRAKRRLTSRPGAES